MTVGDLIDILQRLEELEAKIRNIKLNPDEYLQPDYEIQKLQGLIGHYRSIKISE